MKFQRMLRVIGEDATERQSLDDGSLSKVSVDDLEELYFAIAAELKRRSEKLKGNVKIYWESVLDTVDSISSETKKPYLAVLSLPSEELETESQSGGIKKEYLSHLTKLSNRGKFDFDFLKLNRSKTETNIKVYFEGYLRIGSILKGRNFESESYFYEVTNTGLKVIDEIIAVRKLNKFYLKK
jgi:hypothetical protein